MKKIQRLEMLKNVFGSNLVLPYFVCESWYDIKMAINYFDDNDYSWGVRTDTKVGEDQGFLLPFIHECDEFKIRDLYNQFENDLHYIVVKNIPPHLTLCNCSAQKIGETSFIVEWDKGKQSQRHMEVSDGLNRVVSGKERFDPAIPNAKVIKHTSKIMKLIGFNKLYDTSISYGIDNVVWSVASSPVLKDSPNKIWLW